MKRSGRQNLYFTLQLTQHYPPVITTKDIHLWISKNDKYIFNDYAKANQLSRPKTIQFDITSLVDILGRSTAKWIQRKSDTSISLDKDNCFHSQGTHISLLNNVYINPISLEIYKQEPLNEYNLAICGSSHHTKDVMAWTYIKNNVNNLANHLKYIHANKIQDRQFYIIEKPAFVINTKWSSHNFYHWFHEAVPRLFTFINTISTTQRKRIELIWLSNDKPSSYHLKTLVAMGINPNTIKIIKDNQNLFYFKQYYHLTFVEHGSFHFEQVKISQDIFANISKSTSNNFKCYDRIFILRKQSSARSIANEEEVVKYLSEKNFKCLYFEDIKLEEQIYLAKNAEFFGGIHGAGMTHIINCQSGAKILELMPSDSVHPLYWYLSGIKSLRYSMLPSKVVANNQKFEVNIKALDDQINALDSI